MKRESSKHRFLKKIAKKEFRMNGFKVETESVVWKHVRENFKDKRKTIYRIDVLAQKNGETIPIEVAHVELEKIENLLKWFGIIKTFPRSNLYQFTLS